jgi:hypothetical protein
MEEMSLSVSEKIALNCIFQSNGLQNCGAVLCAGISVNQTEKGKDKQ